MEIIDSLKKDGKLISFDGYLYRKDRICTTTINWRCTVKGCKGRLITSSAPNEGDVPDVTGQHCHIPNPARAAVKQLHSRITERAVRTQDPPRRIIQDEVQTLPREAAASIRCNKNLAAMINRKRKRVHHAPPCPISRNGFIIPDNYTVTMSGEQFLLFDSGMDDEDRILIFGTNRMVQLMAQYQHWFIDGTFSVSPDIFYQLFTVHVLVQETVVPCLYGLLPNKSRETYRRFWDSVRSNTEEFDLQPVSVLTDFELASIQAVKDTFPNTNVTGCFFHLGQSLWRHVQNAGLYNSYVTNDDIRTQVKSLLALAFLPVDEVPAAFDELTENFAAELQQVSNYFEDVYVGRRARRGRRQPTFPPSMWNMYDRQSQGLPRTNNSVESWHQSFHRSLQCDHPSLWKLLTSISKENGLQELVLTQTLSGSRPLPKKAHYKRVDAALNTLLERRQDMPLLDFLRGCSYNLEMNV